MMKFIMNEDPQEDIVNVSLSMDKLSNALTECPCPNCRTPRQEDGEDEAKDIEQEYNPVDEAKEWEVTE